MSDEGLPPYGTAEDGPARYPRSSRLIGAAAVLLAAAVGGGFAAGWASRGAPPGLTSVASPGGAGVAPLVSGRAMGASATTVVDPGGGWSVAFGTAVGQKVVPLGKWTTPDGIAVRVYRNLIPRSGSLPTECSPTGVLIIELSDVEAVYVADVPLYPNAGQKVEVMSGGVWGVQEGAPAAWAVIGTAAGIDKVSVSFDGGIADVVTPVDGLAIVASRVPAGGFAGTVVASGSSGASTIPLKEAPGPIMAPACMPAPPTTEALPPPGAQPTDPTAARTAVTKAIGIVFGGVPSPDQFAYVQGATTSVKAAQKTAADNNPTAHTSTIVQQIVFTSPTTGAVRYELLDNGSQVLDPISQVVLEGGVWKVTSESACAAYALGGGHC